MRKVELSICIVSFKAEKSLQKCLRSIALSKTKVPYEVVVVDNDISANKIGNIVKKFPRVKYFKSSKNGGYGAGNNLALSNSLGEFVLVLNPDTFISKNTIDVLYTYLKKHPDCAGVGPSYQINEKGFNVALGTGELKPSNAIFALSFLNKLFPSSNSSKSYYLEKKDRVKDSEVWAISGSCGMFRKKAVEEVGKYDENLFLYYEESDLGKRLVKGGYKLWITNKTKVFHPSAQSTKRIEEKKIKRIFADSRFYYFKKHFGLLNAILVEVFARFGKYEAFLALTIIAGTFLRLFRLEENIVFHGELGDNYLAMKNILSTGIIPFLGPPTSHPWLSFGPLYYWIFTPVLLFLQFSPVAMSYVFAILGSLLILLNYLVISRLFSRHIAFVSSTIIAFSPIYIWFTRESRFFSLVLILFYPFFYSLINKRYFWTGFWISVMLHFHLTPIIYIPPVIIYLFVTNKGAKKHFYYRFLLGFIIPQLPFIIANIQNGGGMLVQAVEWIPYRILGFLGILPKNNFSGQVLNENSKSILYFLNSVFSSNNSTLLSILILSATIYFSIRTIISKQNKNFSLVVSFLIFGIISIFVHGEPPIHYYLPLFPVLILLVSYLSSLLNKPLTYVFYLLMVLMILTNINYYFSEKWFFIDQSRYRDEIPVPFTLQEKIFNVIISDAQGYPFTLKRVGRFDNFSDNYAQNYIYLLAKAGNSPKKNQILTYTIYENTIANSKEVVIFNEGGITVTR